jgi:hypothetical protein
MPIKPPMAVEERIDLDALRVGLAQLEREERELSDVRRKLHERIDGNARFLTSGWRSTAASTPCAPNSACRRSQKPWNRLAGVDRCGIAASRVPAVSTGAFGIKSSKWKRPTHAA